jgi:sugar O-acyltransferase (sialic acid O-acetyltransferase NeuD family)
MSKILIFGMSNITFDMIESCDRNKIKCFVLNNLAENIRFHKISIFSKLNNQKYKKTPAIMGVASPKAKISCKLAADQFQISRWTNLFDRNVIVPKRIELGKGIYINAGVVIGSNTQIHNFCTINRGALIGHHVEIDDYTFVGPGSIINGNVKIGENVFIGAGAVIKDGINIGQGAVIGAGAVVVKDVYPDQVIIGNPGKPYNKYNLNQ